MELKHKAAEALLYHGTSHEVADAICFQNFDFRLCGRHGTMYGKGGYFSTSARYSHQYSKPDLNGHYYMFIAQVLVGRYAEVGVVLILNNARLYFFIILTSILYWCYLIFILINFLHKLETKLKKNSTGFDSLQY